jgi:hypothetical protein
MIDTFRRYCLFGDTGKDAASLEFRLICILSIFHYS